MKGNYLDVASEHPATSSRGNYVAFVSQGTAIDLPLGPGPGGTDLVYVRYLGEQ